MSETQPSPLTLEELPELRRKTEAISQILKQQVVGHFETLRPLLAPERILGKLAGGKSEVAGAEVALEGLRRDYRPFTRKPYDLPADFNTTWLPLVGNALELHPWEYAQPVGSKAITITSPVRWIVNYRSNLSLSQVKGMLTGKETPRLDYLRQFVVNALVLQILLARTPGLGQLFADLRYELKTETLPELGGLPMVTITSILNSFRPADHLILAATAFSGVPEFIELVDLESLQVQKDLVRQKIDQVLQG